MPATTKKNVDPSHTIEYQRTVINDMAGDLHSIFTGTAAINAATIQLGGADIGNISDVDSQTIFFYYGGFSADTSVSSPAKISEIYSHEDATRLHMSFSLLAQNRLIFRSLQDLQTI